MRQPLSVKLDREIYLDILEPVYTTADREGVDVLFRILNRDSEDSELPVNAQFPQSLITTCGTTDN